jgi:hypothetical protein
VKTLAVFCLAAGAALLASAAPAAMPPTGDVQVVPPDELSQKLAVRDVRVNDGEVTGTVVNNSSRPLRDLKLLVDYAWLWRNERHPGTDSPGRAFWTTIPGELRPGESRDFHFRPDTPLAQRSDGRFAPSVKVSEVTELVPESATAGRR